MKKETIKQGIESYTGRTVEKVDTFTDSIGAVAVRAHMGDNETLTFLIAAFDVEKCTSAAQIERHLEECEFTAWPPVDTGRPQWSQLGV